MDGSSHLVRSSVVLFLKEERAMRQPGFWALVSEEASLSPNASGEQQRKSETEVLSVEGSSRQEEIRRA